MKVLTHEKLFYIFLTKWKQTIYYPFSFRSKQFGPGNMLHISCLLMVYNNVILMFFIGHNYKNFVIFRWQIVPYLSWFPKNTVNLTFLILISTQFYHHNKITLPKTFYIRSITVIVLLTIFNFKEA